MGLSAIDYWIWLSGMTGVSRRSIAALLSHYGSAEAAFFADKGEFGCISGISRSDAAALEQRDMSRVSDIYEKCAKQNISIVTLQDAVYPKRLKNIFAPPVALYIKGKLPDVDGNALISVIGTRKADAYGLSMGSRIASGICSCGGIVVSGLTTGVDAAAARGAVQSGGICVGVLGTAHEASQGELAKTVAENGALISEYPPDTYQMKSFFRDRNRISAGFSLGVVVVEAPEKSGTQLFVSEAAEQGKELFAVPGNADSPNSVGTNAMIKDGAKPVIDGWDVMSEFQMLFPDKIKKCDTKPAPAPCPEPETRTHSDVSTKKAVDKENDKGYIGLHEQLESLSEDELKIITAVGGTAVHIDDIIEQTGLGTAKVLSQLTMLELKGYIGREPGMRIVLKTAKK